MNLLTAIMKKMQPAVSVPAPQQLDPALYTGDPSYIRRFVLEITQHCNLRCRYCHQNKPDFVPTDELAQGTFDDIVDYLSRHPIDVVDLTGGGDIIMASDWANKCNRLLELSIKLDITVNLGKILDRQQIDTLSRFNIVTASIDTMDREILTSVRKSVDIRTIVYNMMRIKAAAIRRGNKDLRWIISAVYSAEVVNHLPELAAYAVAFGAMAFQIQDMMQFNDITDNVTSVWTLHGDAAVKAVNATKEAIDYASHHGLTAQMPPDWIQRLDDLTARAYVPETQAQINEGSSVTTYNTVPGKGMTRDCIDPWTFMQILSNTQVRPCCFSHVKIGSVRKETGGIEGALNSEAAITLRKELLTGQLDEYCSICSFKPSISTEVFQQKIGALVKKQPN